MPKFKYQHSEVFARLKAISENIKINLTSLEYLQILDYFLKNAWKKVVLHYPEFTNNYLAKILSFVSFHRSYKVCSEPKQTFPILVYQCIQATNASKVTAFDHIHLNRGIIFGLLSQWLNLAEKRNEIWSPFTKGMTERERFIASDLIDQQLDLKDKDNFQAVYTEVIYWYNKARDFRTMICQKYTRFALLQAQKAYVQYNYRISLNDISVIYCLIVGKAIDRCDARFGVLTSFIQNWMKSAQCQVAKLAKQDNHYSLEALHEQYGDYADLPYIELKTNDEVNDIAYKAQLADPDGVLRATLGIPEFVSIDDYTFLKKLIINESN